MKHAFRTTVVLLCIVGLSGLACFLVGLGKAVPPPPPNPNGYYAFIQAGNLLGNETSDAYEMEFEKLRNFIATHAGPIRLMRLGLSQTCSVPMLEFLTNMIQRVGDLAATKRLAQFWAANGRLAEMEGRTNDAANIYVEGICFGAKINRGGFLIHAFVSHACESIPAVSLARLVSALDCKPSRNLIAELERCDQNAATWDEVWTNEKLFMRHELRKDFKPARWLGIWQSYRRFRGVRFKHDAITARRRLILTELAIRCYKIKNARPPRQLAELVPKYLQCVPQDPFTNRPLIFVRRLRTGCFMALARISWTTAERRW